jgi:hypothetical protein
MSILAQLNTTTGEWAVNADPETPSPVLEIGFVGPEPTVTFDGLSFGWSCAVEGKEPLSAAYPPDGVKYVSTDQAYISTDTISLDYEDSAVLSIWAENAGQRYETEVVVNIPPAPEATVEPIDDEEGS